MTSGTGVRHQAVVGSEQRQADLEAAHVGGHHPIDGQSAVASCAEARTHGDAALDADAPEGAVTPLQRFGAATGAAAVLAVGIATLAETTHHSWAPAWVWWVVYGVYLAAFALDAFVPFDRTARTDRQLVAVLILAGSTLFLLEPHGWTGVVFVVTAASAAFVVSSRALAAIVAGQTTVVAVGLAAVGDWSAAEVLLGSIVYGSFMAFAALVVLGQRNEAQARDELEQAHGRLAMAHHDLERTHAELRAATALLAASSRSAERLRISRDLHDLVGHQLTALALELEVASHETLADREHVLRARSIAKDLLRDVRAAVGDLRVTPRELEPALRELVRDLPGLDVELTVDEQVPVDDAEAVTVVRSVQELITNTLRHADATRITIRVLSDRAGVRLHVHDDGRGARVLLPGNGLLGLRERIEEHGGEVVFVPGGQGDGFAVDARLPAP